MLEVKIENIIPISEAQGNFDQIVEGVANSDDMYVLTKDGKPSAILVGIHHLEKLIPGEMSLSSLGAAQGAATAVATSAVATEQNNVAPAPVEAAAPTQNAQPFSYDNVTAGSSSIEPSSSPVAVDSMPSGSNSETSFSAPVPENPVATGEVPQDPNLNPTPDMSVGLNDDSFAMPTEPPTAPVGAPTDTQASIQVNDEATTQPTNIADISADSNGGNPVAQVPVSQTTNDNQIVPPAAPQF